MEPRTEPRAPEAHTCRYCGCRITDQRKLSGSKRADWATADGDFGCDASPDTTADGVGDHTPAADDERALNRERAALLAILQTLTDHASETYPHFESERGQREIERARALLADAQGVERA